jgi:hemoglobin
MAFARIEHGERYPASEMETIYSRCGGAPALARLVFKFYDRVLASERLAPYFAHVDMTRLVEHQTKFIASVMGGPPSFTDTELRDAHAHLSISDAVFDEMTDLLETTLHEFGIDSTDIGQVMGSIRNKRRLIVGEVDEETHCFVI